MSLVRNTERRIIFHVYALRQAVASQGARATLTARPSSTRGASDLRQVSQTPAGGQQVLWVLRRISTRPSTDDGPKSARTSGVANSGRHTRSGPQGSRPRPQTSSSSGNAPAHATGSAGGCEAWGTITSPAC